MDVPHNEGKHTNITSPQFMRWRIYNKYKRRAMHFSFQKFLLILPQNTSRKKITNKQNNNQ